MNLDEGYLKIKLPFRDPSCFIKYKVFVFTPHMSFFIAWRFLQRLFHKYLSFILGTFQNSCLRPLQVLSPI